MSLLRRSNGNYASIQTRRPMARSEDLVLEEFEDELLVYDRKNNRAHCLGVTAARVWRACDGKTDEHGLSSALDLSRDAVLRALEELEACELLDVPELQVVNGNGNGNGITRRQLTMRSAKIGAAAAAAPLVYSVAVPTAMAQASPTPFQCALFSTKDCGEASGAGSVSGCCCCCQSKTGFPACKVGSSTSFCNGGHQTCPDGTIGSCSAGCKTNCKFTANNGGCCSVNSPSAPDATCGCAFAGATPRPPTCGASGTSNGPGSQGCGSGCCDTAQCFELTSCHDSVTSAPCSPGSANCVCTTPCVAGSSSTCVCQGCATPVSGTSCVPCCNGQPITTAAAFNCCNPGLTNTCG